ncbi:hypothetical protein MNBD_UNCLBAC01-1337 [hydrothermal vent metagenome]|uniref:Polymerase nucleotidyl transferase domain-containing protein n=1 Tax=hydrothermal vent metagenome TaxID=652676 RepID=A0A3B1D759_9ZZZZ
MRLDDQEKRALKKALEGVKGEIFLFGSRVDDSKKGGDIDVLILSSENAYRVSQEVSVKFFMECEEKIDVVVMDPDNLRMEQQAFLNVIQKKKFV